MEKFVKKYIRRRPIVSVDGIIVNKKHEILLTKRRIPPFLGHWVLPGGHVRYGERVEHAVQREVEEETGLKTRISHVFGVYSNPKRDPRYHMIGIAYHLHVRSGKLKLNKEVSELKYFSLKGLPKNLGFDHRKIIKDFINSSCVRMEENK